MVFFSKKDSGFYKEKSFLNPSELVGWKRSRNVYNFNSLPELAIIAIKSNAFNRVVSPFTKRIKGINGVHYNYRSKILLCSEFGSGSPAMLMLLEELRALGVKRFIFIGSAGILNSSVFDNNAYLISKVFSSSGSSFFYFEEECIDCYDLKWRDEIKKTCNLDEKMAWSTDCPFRETSGLISHFRNKGCDLVDMESAALYSFSMFYGTPSLCILIGSDILTSKKWQAPKKMDSIIKKQQDLISKLVRL